MRVWLDCLQGLRLGGNRLGAAHTDCLTHRLPAGAIHALPQQEFCEPHAGAVLHKCGALPVLCACVLATLSPPPANSLPSQSISSCVAESPAHMMGRGGRVQIRHLQAESGAAMPIATAHPAPVPAESVYAPPSTVNQVCVSPMCMHRLCLSTYTPCACYSRVPVRTNSFTQICASPHVSAPPVPVSSCAWYAPRSFSCRQRLCAGWALTTHAGPWCRACGWRPR